MFSFLNKNANPIISKFENYRDQSQKCIESQTKAFSSLQDWSLNGNNSAIQDVSTKLTMLFTKLDNDVHSQKINALNDVIQLFEKFKEYDLKLSKLQQEILNAEKVEKKRDDELQKCPPAKNIRDFETRLYRAKIDREKLQLKYYTLTNETDAAKSILYKNIFSRYSDSMIKYMDAEKIVFEGMKQLVNEIPDICEDDLRQLNYSNYNSTTNICNETCIRINDSIMMNTVNNQTTSPHECIRRTRSTRLSKYKKVKPRKSCPAYLSTASVPRLYPSLDALKTQSTSNFSTYVTIPSAPPKSDTDF